MITIQIKSLKLLESEPAVIKEVALLLAFECGRALAYLTNPRAIQRGFRSRPVLRTGPVEGHPDDFWCVWDALSNAPAFGGSLTYLTEADAIARAEELGAPTQALMPISRLQLPRLAASKPL